MLLTEANRITLQKQRNRLDKGERSRKEITESLNRKTKAVRPMQEPHVHDPT